MSDAAAARYVMGHSDRERRRLELQASIINPLTNELLDRARIRRGMSVIEFGCGVGEVTLLLAQRVGRMGRVIAVDIDEVALAATEAKARDRGLPNVTCICANVEQFFPKRPVHAV